MKLMRVPMDIDSFIDLDINYVPEMLQLQYRFPDSYSPKVTAC